MGLIDIRELRFSYPDMAPTLNCVTFELQPGEILGVLGRNGTGKSSLLKLVTGELKADQGSIAVLDRDPFIHREILQNIAVCNLDIVPNTMCTVNQYIDLQSGIYGQLNYDEKPRLLEKFDLNGEDQLSSLSTGKQAAALIISVLLRKCSLYIFDEISAVLDIKMRRAFYQEVKGLAALDEAGVILATNLIEDLEGLADQVLFIEHETSHIKSSSLGLESLFIAKEVI